MNDLLILSAADVEAAFDLDLARVSQREAFTALARDEAILPARLLLPGTDQDVAFCYAAKTGPAAPAVSKFGGVYPGNAGRGLPAVHALLTVLDAETGAPAAVMDGTSVTTLRTAAASAVAAEELSDAEASHLAIIGAGVQALAHLHALTRVRRFTTIAISSRSRENSEALARTWSHEKPHDAPDLTVATSAQEACQGADIIALCTTSVEPVIADTDAKDGALVISVGSFTPERSEVPADLMARARVVVDDRPTALADAGCVVRAAASGRLDTARVETLGEVLTGAIPLTGSSPVTVYASVGIGLQDAAAASAILKAARERGLGQHVQL